MVDAIPISYFLVMMIPVVSAFACWK